MWKVVILSFAALLCTAQGSPYSRLNPQLWSQLVQMMQAEKTETGRCENNECFVSVPGMDTILLKPGESLTVGDSCVEYRCTESSEVVEVPIKCREITNCNGEIIHYPNRCCPVCEGTNVNIECTLLEWGEWGQCSRTCGGGRQVRVRSFTIPEGGDTVFCNESLTQTRDCSTDGCPRNCIFEWGTFGPCSRTCNGGTRRREPNIIVPAINGGQPCPPPQVEECGLVPCEVDCIFEWGAFGPCSRTCNGGTRRRLPNIIREAANGGRACPGPETEDCGQTPCPVDCLFEWGQFGPCSRTCDGGTRSRVPNIIRPAAHGGQACPDPEVENCGQTPCPVDCLFEWGQFGPCSRTCDGGTRSRVPNIIRQSAHGGQACPDPEVENCGQTPCPENCIWEWGPFGPCSRSCDGGTRRRDPNIFRQPAHGGEPCPPHETEDCGLIPCPTVCTLTECTINGVTTCIDPKDDRDGDCITDEVDNCLDTLNPDQSDVDGDGIGDACDSCNLTPRSGPVDQDFDGVEDTCDNCPKTFNPDQANDDNDEPGNMCDDDDDNDGEVDDDDNCQFAANQDQADQDRDGRGDACDNCPRNSNNNQNDADGDGVGNACDNCRFFRNPEQRSDDPNRFGGLCTTKPPGMVDVEDYEGYGKNDDKKGLVADIMERLLEMYYSN